MIIVYPTVVRPRLVCSSCSAMCLTNDLAVQLADYSTHIGSTELGKINEERNSARYVVSRVGHGHGRDGEASRTHQQLVYYCSTISGVTAIY